MKFNLKTPLIDYEGKIQTEAQPPGPDHKPGDQLEKLPVTMRQVITAAVRRDVSGKITSPEEKERIYHIMTIIWKKWQVELSVDKDVAFIMERGRQTLDDLMLGRLTDFLNNREPDVPLPKEDQDRELLEQEKSKKAAN